VEGESSDAAACRILYIIELPPSSSDKEPVVVHEEESSVPELDPEEAVIRWVLARSVCTAEYEDLHCRDVIDYNADQLERGITTSSHHHANLQAWRVEALL
jgi:hypothetical protein